MKTYLYILYLVTTAIITAPCFLIGWAYYEIRAAFRMGVMGGSNFNAAISVAVHRLGGK